MARNCFKPLPHYKGLTCSLAPKSLMLAMTAASPITLNAERFSNKAQNNQAQNPPLCQPGVGAAISHSRTVLRKQAGRQQQQQQQ